MKSRASKSQRKYGYGTVRYGYISHSDVDAHSTEPGPLGSRYESMGQKRWSGAIGKLLVVEIVGVVTLLCQISFVAADSSKGDLVCPVEGRFLTHTADSK